MSSTTRTAHCFRITATDATTVNFTSTSRGLVMSNNEVYTKPANLTFTDREQDIDGSPMLVDLGSIFDVSAFEYDAIASGKWDVAIARYFTTDWSNPVEDDVEVGVFFLGKIREMDGRFVVELMGQADKLNATIGYTCQPTCTKVFCDTHIDGQAIIASSNFRCGLNAVDYTETVSITSVDDDRTFYATGLTSFDDDWFGAGELIFNSGADNYGLGRRIVSSFTKATGKIVLDLPMYYTPEIGDSINILAGCRKRWDVDCRDKHNNGVNHGGFHFVPAASVVGQRGKN